MKQGDKFIRVIMAVLAMMISGYIIYNLANAVSSGVEVVQAVEYTVHEGVSIRGVIVRQETVLTGQYDLNTPTKGEGEKVAKGEEVALSLGNAQAGGLHDRIQTLEERLGQLEQALAYQTQLDSGEAVNRELGQALGTFSSQVSQNSLTAANATADTIKALILRREAGSDQGSSLEGQIAQVKQELADLSGQTRAGTTPVTAPQAGYYSQTADGYEAVLTPEFILTASAKELEETRSSGGKTLGDDTAGRLITSSTWYYAGEVEPEYLKEVKSGDRLTVRFQDKVSLELTMAVCRVDEAQGLLVLSSDQYLSSVSALREGEADVVFQSWSGLRVPKEAVCYDEQTGQAGVFVLVNREADWKAVELIYDAGDAYIAKLDQSKTSNLWPEDLIITETRGLFDGKVVD